MTECPSFRKWFVCTAAATLLLSSCRDDLVKYPDTGQICERTWYQDADGDGFGASAQSLESCEPPAGYVEVGGDCDDGDGAVHPQAAETCDGRDEDCDGEVDEHDAVDTLTWYADEDGDNTGDASSSVTGCSKPEGHVADASDCDDHNPSINRYAQEICDGIDNDCDSLTDEDDAVGVTTWYADADSDGFGDPRTGQAACSQPTGFVVDSSDCDDSVADINPSATETCNGIDDDCDGWTDDQDPDLTDASLWYIDHDGDGFGTTLFTALACTQPSGYVADATDCDDTHATNNPGAVETCDGVDNECDGDVDEDDAADALTWVADADGDGFGDPTSTTTACSQPSGYLPAGDEDCDDTDGTVYHASALGLCLGCDLVVPTEQTTIQGAIDAATAGEVICVQAGTYAENVDYGGKDVHLYGVGGAEETTIQGRYLDSVVTVESGELAAVLEGFTITNGYASDGGGVHIVGSSATLAGVVIVNNVASSMGGGISVDDAGSLALFDAALTSNQAEYGGGISVDDAGSATLGNTSISGFAAERGGGIYMSGDSTVTLEDTTISDSSAEDGGGIYCSNSTLGAMGVAISGCSADDGGGINAFDAQVTLDETRITGCWAERDGGGFYADHSSLDATNLELSGNTAKYGGGALFESASGMLSATEASLRNTIVSGNLAEEHGGGVFVRERTLSIVNTAFIANTALDGDGGGIYASDGELALTSVSLQANDAHWHGGGMHLVSSSIAELQNTAIVGNSAGKTGGGIFASGSSSLALMGTDVWGNQAAQYDGLYCATAAVLSYVNLPDDSTEPLCGTCLAVDPLYLDATAADPTVWDLHLDAVSPLIDAGDPSATDPDGTVADMGIYGGDLAADWDLDGDGDPAWYQAGPYQVSYTGMGLDCQDGDPDVTADAGCPLTDADGDGYYAELTDCDESDAAVHSGASEACNGVDDDCDGEVDEDWFWYPDVDGDGYGDGDNPTYGCTQPPGTVEDSSDCDDTDPAVHPGAFDWNDGVDSDCDGEVGTRSLAEAGVAFIGESEDGHAGCSVAGGGDVDGDGIDDILVGAYREGSGGQTAGAVYLVLGRSIAGIPAGAEFSLAGADAKLTGTGLDDAGYSVSFAGDVNGDGFDDMLTAANKAPTVYGEQFGAIYVLLGPLTGELPLSTAGVALSAEGTSVSDAHVSGAGDVNGDGYADILVGCKYDDGAGDNAGAAFLVLGPATPTPALSLAQARLSGENPNDYAGDSVAGAGDVDGDGIDDILVGARGEDTAGSSAGATYLVLGPLSGELSLSAADAKLTGELGSDSAGQVAGAGDVNGDGYADVLIGACGENTASSDAGAAYLVLGPVSGERSLSQAQAKLTGEGKGDWAGDAVSGAGDVDRDGHADILVGAYGASAVDGSSYGGAVYLVLGPVSGELSLSDADAKLYGENYEYAGQSVSGAGDMDGNGFGDILVGAYANNSHDPHAGAAYLIFGEGL